METWEGHSVFLKLRESPGMLKDMKQPQPLTYYARRIPAFSETGFAHSGLNSNKEKIIISLLNPGRAVYIGNKTISADKTPQGNSWCQCALWPQSESNLSSCSGVSEEDWLNCSNHCKSKNRFVAAACISMHDCWMPRAQSCLLSVMFVASPGISPPSYLLLAAWSFPLHTFKCQFSELLHCVVCSSFQLLLGFQLSLRFTEIATSF